jgi:hypothetical protein
MWRQAAVNSIDLLVESFGRVRGLVHDVVGDLSVERLTFRPDSQANSIAWLVWHLTRGQDAQLAEAMGTSQVWTADGWVTRFHLPFDADATGYGQDHLAVAKVCAPSDLLIDYHDAVHARTLDLVSGLQDPDLDRVIDHGWDPPVTLGVRLVSIISDDLEHLGQAAYINGLAERIGDD